MHRNTVIAVKSHRIETLLSVIWLLALKGEKQPWNVMLASVRKIMNEALDNQGTKAYHKQLSLILMRVRKPLNLLTKLQSNKISSTKMMSNCVWKLGMTQSSSKIAIRRLMVINSPQHKVVKIAINRWLQENSNQAHRTNVLLKPNKIASSYSPTINKV